MTSSPIPSTKLTSPLHDLTLSRPITAADVMSLSSPLSRAQTSRSLCPDTHTAVSELKDLKYNIGKSIKTKKKWKRNEFGKIMFHMDQDDILHEHWESWAQKHRYKLGSRFSLQEVRELREWFVSLDKDGGGTVGIEELLEPLLSAGIFRSREDVEALIKRVDGDNSGDINLEEFLCMFENKSICDADGVELLKRLTRPPEGGFSTRMVLSEERRRRMMRGVVDEMAYRTSTVDEIVRQLDAPCETEGVVAGTLPSHRGTQRPSHTEKPGALSSVHMGDMSKKRSNHRRNALPSVLLDDHFIRDGHRVQQRNICLYLDSVKRIVADQKETIAADDAVSTTCETDTYGVNLGNIVEDPSLDVGYRGGKQGRMKSMQRLKAVDSERYGMELHSTLQKTDSCDYSIFDSSELYNTVEVYHDDPHVSIRGKRRNLIGENLAALPRQTSRVNTSKSKRRPKRFDSPQRTLSVKLSVSKMVNGSSDDWDDLSFETSCLDSNNSPSSSSTASHSPSPLSPIPRHFTSSKPDGEDTSPPSTLRTSNNIRSAWTISPKDIRSNRLKSITNFKRPKKKKISIT
mmetsp:Transcript_26577/g.39484  ORF Transcript_26577/g.39484 Transcript_26577/m.39484 type:complete len:573 (+) Transcript_26577:216-1934(+)|eukprot:CAMPEP_0185031186 /NCGR_PEP_ID=MMETSP1103-20130426/18517_1 /TAXON_ID=36769 /ORGANISM="Paraphysomonas bandaiensis, Strain Caron Lab Isolate" /LENGTH=572 /DNA_ID=CAMNT_0027566625 /DNA_START=169 /DNA_END=1887 /DNA_ORIENTATION=-